MQNFTKGNKITRVLNAVAAGTTDQNGTTIDMLGFESVTFIVSFGTITTGAVTSIKAQQDTDSAAGTMEDLEGSSVTVADDDDNQVVVLEIVKPQERYVRVVVDRGTQNAVIDGAIAIQHGPRVMPVTHDATTVVTHEVHASPAEGTA